MYWTESQAIEIEPHVQAQKNQFCINAFNKSLAHKVSKCIAIKDKVFMKSNDRCVIHVRCTTPAYLPGLRLRIFGSNDNASLVALQNMVFCANKGIFFAQNPESYCRPMQPTLNDWINTHGADILRTAYKARNGFSGSESDTKRHTDRWDRFLDLMMAGPSSYGEARKYAKQWANRGWAPWVQVVDLLVGW